MSRENRYITEGFVKEINTKIQKLKEVGFTYTEGKVSRLEEDINDILLVLYLFKEHLNPVVEVE